MINKTKIFLVCASIIIIIILAIVAFFGIKYFNNKSNEILARQELTNKQLETEKLFSPEIKVPEVNCEIEGEKELKTSRSLDLSMSVVSVPDTANKIKNLLKDYTATSTAFSYSDYTSTQGSDYSQVSIETFMKNSEVNDFIKKLDSTMGASGIWLSKSDYANGAKQTTLNCLHYLNELKSLQFKETAILDQLKNNKELYPYDINNFSNELSHVRQVANDYLSMSELDVNKVTDNTSIRIWINKLKG